MSLLHYCYSHDFCNRLSCLENETDEDWKPLRKVDCLALNHTSESKIDGKSPPTVLIEGGRSTAYPNDGKIEYNYADHTQRPPRLLIKATWFYKIVDPNDNKKHILVPIKEEYAVPIEDLYQRANVHESFESIEGSNETALNQLMQETLSTFEDDNYHIMLQKSSDNTALCIKKLSKGWFFGKACDVQRGYGQYEVKGEMEEESLGPISDVIFVIHGIGEAMWSREDFTYSNSLWEDVDGMRYEMQKRQLVEWHNQCKAAEKAGLRKSPPPPGRIEIIPIFWYDRIHSSSNTLMRSLQGATLNSIPALREIANDVIFDVLMYLTPTFQYEVLECCTSQICQYYTKFNLLQGSNYKGSFSLMGHSLGSVIAWDLLCLLKEQRQDFHRSNLTTPTNANDIPVYQHYASEENANIAKKGSWGPSLPKKLEHRLPFIPKFTIFLGSPLGLFLTLRGAHPCFEDLRDDNNIQNASTSLKISPFTLPSGSISNIFNPSDPIAYRIESLLLPQDTKEIPPPLYLTRQGQDVRLHLKARQIGDDIYKSFQLKQKSVTALVTSLTEQAQKVLQQVDDSSKKSEQTLATTAKNYAGSDDDGPLRFPLAGIAKTTGRIDLQLQPKMIDNEYLSCITAHIGYWFNADILDYIIDLARRQDEEEVVGGN